MAAVTSYENQESRGCFRKFSNISRIDFKELKQSRNLNHGQQLEVTFHSLNISRFRQDGIKRCLALTETMRKNKTPASRWDNVRKVSFFLD